jgi:Na+/H+ antiporter NhaD/arsenite permease-like protein
VAALLVCIRFASLSFSLAAAHLLESTCILLAGCADTRCACVVCRAVLCLAAVLQAVDTHGGFNRLAAWVRADQRQTLTWFVALLTFCMSAVLDNLTTTIVMISVLQVRLSSSQQHHGLVLWGCRGVLRVGQVG